MLTYEERRKKEQEQERELEKKFLGIMEKHKDEPCDKIVKYKISLDDEKELEAWEKFKGRTEELLEEVKFFYPIYGAERPCRSAYITGTPEFTKELCEFFVVQAGISRTNIREAEEVTKEKIEEWITFRSDLLIARLGWYQDKAYGCAPRLIGLNDKMPQVEVYESYDGGIFLDINRERAFVDLDGDSVVIRIKEYLDNFANLQYTVVEREDNITLNIKAKHNHCIALWDIFMKGFGRHNMNDCYLVIGQERKNKNMTKSEFLKTENIDKQERKNKTMRKEDYLKPEYFEEAKTLIPEIKELDDIAKNDFGITNELERITLISLTFATYKIKEYSYDPIPDPSFEDFLEMVSFKLSYYMGKKGTSYEETELIEEEIKSIKTYKEPTKEEIDNFMNKIGELANSKLLLGWEEEHTIFLVYDHLEDLMEELGLLEEESEFFEEE